MVKVFVFLSVSVRERTLLWRDRFVEGGATSTEYAIMMGMIAFSIIIGVQQFGGRLTGEYTRISNTIPS